MTPTAMLLALTILVAPPDPPIGPDAPQGAPQAMYVHCLSCPAVDVSGLDQQFLAESVSVVRCESTHREGATNASGATGLLQVMLPLHLPKATALGYTGADLLQAEPNLRVAHVIWARQGWRPWSCRHTPVPVVGSDHP